MNCECWQVFEKSLSGCTALVGWVPVVEEVMGRGDHAVADEALLLEPDLKGGQVEQVDVTIDVHVDAATA